jgi:hypothetical protein
MHCRSMAATLRARLNLIPARLLSQWAGDHWPGPVRGFLMKIGCRRSALYLQVQRGLHLAACRDPHLLRVSSGCDLGKEAS